MSDDKNEGGWLRLRRGDRDRLGLLLRRPYAWALYTLFALRARYKAGVDVKSGLDLELYELVTGRGDRELIGATEKQYRVARDFLIKKGFVATVPAKDGAMYGTVIKIADSNIYWIKPLEEGQAEGQAEGQGGAGEGPGRGHEQRSGRPLDQETTSPLPPTGEETPAGGDGGGDYFFSGDDEEYIRLACRLAQKDPVGLEIDIRRRITEARGLDERRRKQLEIWKKKEAETTANRARVAAATAAAEGQRGGDPRPIGEVIQFPRQALPPVGPIWTAAREQLLSKIPGKPGWLASLTAREEEGHIVLTAPDAWMQQMITTRYLPQIREAVLAAGGQGVEIVCADQPAAAAEK